MLRKNLNFDLEVIKTKTINIEMVRCADKIEFCNDDLKPNFLRKRALNCKIDSFILSLIYNKVSSNIPIGCVHDATFFKNFLQSMKRAR